LEVKLSHIYVFDLDGTLSDCRHRIELWQNRNFREFNEMSKFDNQIEDCCKLFRKLSKDNDVWILTARSEEFRKLTLDWLDKNALKPDKLLMRRVDDFSSDFKCKSKLLIDEFGGDLKEALSSISVIFDDRDCVVEGFRNLGFSTFQVNSGGL